MEIKQIKHGGWENNLRLANGEVELIISLDVGPRILSYRTTDGKNVLKNYDEQMGKSGESEWMIRGGHRLWIAPEDEQRSYVPDNESITHTLRDDDSVALENEGVAPWHLKKELTISLNAESSQVTLHHKVTNESEQPAEVASWGLSVMAPGGMEIIPLPPLGKHPCALLPNRTMIAWPYTDLADPRWRFGSKFITLKQTADGAPTKLGLAHTEKWIGYLLDDTLFVKTFPLEPDAEYPDRGCNFETFTNGDMLEIESLGPLRKIAPGESTSHTEVWHLFSGVTQPHSLKENEIAEWIEPFLHQMGL